MGDVEVLLGQAQGVDAVRVGVGDTTPPEGLQVLVRDVVGSIEYGVGVTIGGSQMGGSDPAVGQGTKAEQLGHPLQVGLLVVGDRPVGTGDVEEAVQNVLEQAGTIAVAARQLAGIALVAVGGLTSQLIEALDIAL